VSLFGKVKPRLVKPTGVTLPEALLAAVRDRKAELASALSEPDLAEREAIAIEMSGVPKAYARAFADIQANRPANVPRQRWKLAYSSKSLARKLSG
jgi:hypothetical protein